MKIGLISTSIGNFGQDGFYNVQEIGLARVLDQYMEKVWVYKLIPGDQKETVKCIEGCKNTVLHLIPSKRLGSNGIPDVRKLDTSIDALICFSDTQISTPYLYHWAKSFHIPFYPYIGVLESHSTNRIIRTIVNIYFKRNLKVYRSCCCLAKTPKVKNELEISGVEKVITMPVGLDESLLNDNYKSADVVSLKHKYGFAESDKIILFIGRLTTEKEPVKMVEIFWKLFCRNSDYRLLMVGTGELKENVISKAKELGIFSQIRMIDRLPNNRIWELYRLSDYFVNLNHQEIFGMAILEAMYYECRVVAWKAPGPELIIQNEVSGYLVESVQEVVETICQNRIPMGDMHDEVSEKFTWNKTARILLDVIEVRSRS